MLFLSLLLFSADVDPRYLLSCEQYDWLVSGVYKSQLLTPSEKLKLIFRFADGTDPKCFEEKL